MLFAHADEHRFRLDYGMKFEASAEPVANVTRLETFGDENIHGSLVMVDPASAQVFLPAPLLVPGNGLPKLLPAAPGPARGRGRSTGAGP